MDWTKLHPIDNVDLHEDAQGRVATARFRLAAADRDARPRRGDPADPLVPGWLVDKVALTAYSPSHDYVVVTARPAIALGSSFEQPGLRATHDVRLQQADFFFSSQVMGVQPLPPRPTGDAVWPAATVTVGAGVPGHAPIQRDPDDPEYLLDWAAAALAPPAACPFTRVPGWSLHQQTLRTDIATIAFHVRANFLDRYLDFGGVTDGSDAAIPARFRLPEATVPGRWRAIDQTIEPATDADGQPFWRIRRRLQRVPPGTDAATGASLAWDPAKHAGALRWLHA